MHNHPHMLGAKISNKFNIPINFLKINYLSTIFFEME
jgi:hypothetical protein